MTHKTHVRLADGHEQVFEHIKNVAISEAGVFVLLNARGEQVGFFPIMHTASLTQPGKDTDIVLPPTGLVVPA
jgi:hypothetical protein